MYADNDAASNKEVLTQRKKKKKEEETFLKSPLHKSVLIWMEPKNLHWRHCVKYKIF